jgi:hypothetical protein
MVRVFFMVAFLSAAIFNGMAQNNGITMDTVIPAGESDRMTFPDRDDFQGAMVVSGPVGLLQIETVYPDEMDEDIETFLNINGSITAYDMAFEQLISHFRQIRSGAPESLWSDLRSQILEHEVRTLNKLLVPIYKRYFSHDEIKALVAFYQTPAGAKFTGTIGLITREATEISQEWAIGLGQKIVEYLEQAGY